MEASRPQIAVLDASIGETAVERNFRRELDTVVTVFKSSEGQLPPTPTGDGRFPHAGAVVSGSQTAVYDDRPWIDEVESWIRAASDAGVPVLGVCWGHQLIAQAFDGTVDPMGRYELGYEHIKRTGETDPLFDGIADSFVAFETHSDEVTSLPAGATVLAENSTSIQAFRIGTAWGVQFHPEYDLRTARWVTENKCGEVPSGELDRTLRSITPERHTEAGGIKRIFDNFLRFAKRGVNTQPTGTGG